MNPDHVPSRSDTTRPGPARTVWEAHFPWEGTRLLAQIEGLPVASGPLTLHAYVSESPEVRALLRGTVIQRLRDQPTAAVRIRSAYKTGYFWLLEEVQPLWRRHQADRLTVTYPVLPSAGEGRFLQELYPLAAVLEREGLDHEFIAAEAAPQYGAAIWRGDVELWRGTCALPLHQRTAPDGRAVLAPTGRLTVWDGPAVLCDERLPTDGELFWDWYGVSVMPHLLDLADQRRGLPTFKNLSVSLHLSEPDLALGVLDERVSMTEALTEEVYFGTLDALKAQAGRPASDRSLMPGRIAPVALSTPGQDGRARVVLTPWGETTYPAEFTAESAPAHPEFSDTTQSFPARNQPWKPARLWADARQRAQRHGLEWRIPAYSVDGRPIPVVLRTPREDRALVGGVLVTGGQHANETTGAVAASRLIDPLAMGPLPFAVVPIENPDGAHLHRALTQLNPDHMHHAARYTSLGDDLEVRLRVGQARWEARARSWAAEQVGASLHINLHGYPAHEWVRPYSGYAPFGFESWALPVGFMTIIWHHPGYGQSARLLAEAIAARLAPLTDIAEHAALACRAAAAHVETPHYELIRGLPFLVAERPEALCPLTVITEAPDETVYGRSFEMFVRAHVVVGEAALEYHSRTKGQGGLTSSPCEA